MIDRDKKRIILTLRWAVIIITSYLILFSKTETSHLPLLRILVVFYILSNIALNFFPVQWFSRLRLFFSLLLFDTTMVILATSLSQKTATDFYYVFFLIIMFASIGSNFKLLMMIGGGLALVYGFLLYSQGLFSTEESSSYILRIPFIFIMTAFYGFVVQILAKDRGQKLTLSDDKYRSLFENANEGMILLRGPLLEIIDMNQEAETRTGYAKEELMEKEIFILFGAEEIEKARYFFMEVAQTGEGKTDNLSLTRKDGPLFEINLSAKKISLEDEFIYQMIFRDISKHREIEKKIRTSKRGLELIFDGIRGRLSIQSPDYRILRVNKAVIQKYVTTYNKLIGQKCYEIYFQRTEPCEKCPLPEAIETGRASAALMEISPDRPALQVIAYPILDEEGKLVSIIEYIGDTAEG